MYRVITIAREFGSGGAAIAGMIAERLKWRLVDNALVMAIAAAAKVDPALARRYDEKVDSWLHRVSRRGLAHGAFEAVVANTEIFDAETVAALSKSLIHEAHRRGDCVIVGRGAQCILQQFPDVFHVFIYAPWAERVKRVRERLPAERDPAGLIEETERVRERYVRLFHACERNDPHLYHLMVSSAIGEEAVAAAILCAMHGGAPHG
jgi:cytidylate kinase